MVDFESACNNERWRCLKTQLEFVLKLCHKGDRLSLPSKYLRVKTQELNVLLTDKWWHRKYLYLFFIVNTF